MSVMGLMACSSTALAQTCPVNMTLVTAQISRLETSYGDTLSDISCDAPTIPAQRILCGEVGGNDDQLWTMSRLDDLAFAYAYENATKTEFDPDNTPRDAAFIARRDACKDQTCLCEALIAHSNASLGGLSPYTHRQ
ncbi:hypothetical protein [Novosphingobium barchaimii]|nr:hypothetical protein [Novosphingobium barchaimii]